MRPALHARARAAKIQPPMVYVTTGNSISPGTHVMASPYLGAASKDHHYIGSGDVSGFKIAINNWCLSTTATNSMNVMEMWVTYGTTNTTGVAVTWGGSTTTTVPGGAVEYLSDLITPAMFGLSVFPRDAKLTIGSRIEMAANAVVPGTVDRNPTSNSSIAYTPGTTVIGNLQGQAVMTYGSGAQAVGDNAYPGITIIGNFVTPNPRVTAFVGDSIVYGYTIDNTIYNPGFTYRALFDNYTARTGAHAGIVIGLAGSNASLWSADSGVRTALGIICKRANTFFERYGINAISSDTGSSGASTVISARKTNVWDWIRANPAVNARAPQIIALPLTPHTSQKLGTTTSATNVTTTATLTPATGQIPAVGSIITTTGFAPAAYNVTLGTVTAVTGTSFSYTMASDPGGSATTLGTWKDTWNTDQNQTPTAGCGLGQTIAYVDSQLTALAGTGAAGPDYYIDNTSSVRASTDKSNALYWNWKGAVPRNTEDGLHPNGNGYPLMATDVTNWLNANP